MAKFIEIPDTKADRRIVVNPKHIVSIAEAGEGKVRVTVDNQIDNLGTMATLEMDFDEIRQICEEAL